jgi:D-alanine-D-alanine ligase-like ATP-grasp enzyme
VYSVQRKTGSDTREDIMTFDKKWKNWENIEYIKYDDPNLKEYVKRTFDVLKMSDYARIDVRIDASGRFYFIDPNANPFFGPVKETHATYSIILDMYGIDFTETLKRIFINTLKDPQNNSAEVKSN